MSFRHSYLALPIALLAACGPAKTDRPSRTEEGAKGPVTVAIAPYAGGPLKVSNAGVGPINGAMAFDLATLKVLFPKAKVEQAFLHSSDGPPGQSSRSNRTTRRWPRSARATTARSPMSESRPTTRAAPRTNSFWPSGVIWVSRSTSAGPARAGKST